MIVIAPKIIKFLTFSNKIAGITIYPWILLSDEKYLKNDTLVNHEKIHLRQQIETGVILFYIWYLVEFTIRLILLRNWEMAYKRISFENEAYENDEDLQYLNKRKHWAFLHFL
ncbi:MAG: hypothetical protein K1X55_00725 [Chitinophagales bacterium]|nr:hypothetical protein [Chitinophagales bacterium]